MSKKPTALRRLPQINLELLTGWNKLEETEQAIARSETHALTESLFTIGNARLAAGEHFFKLRDIYRKQRGMWEAFVKSLSMSRATVNRYIKNYEVARTILPKPVMQVAMLRGMDTINAKMVESHPPPKTRDHAKIGRYLDKLQRPQLVLIKDSIDDESKRTLNKVRLAYDRVGNRGKAPFMERLIGMEMTLAGIEGRRFDPIPIPDDFVIRVGRPAIAAPKAA